MSKICILLFCCISAHWSSNILKNILFIICLCLNNPIYVTNINVWNIIDKIRQIHMFKQFIIVFCSIYNYRDMTTSGKTTTYY